MTADRDGIRTVFSVGPPKSKVKIKFDILLEGLIDLQGSVSKALGVPTLSVDCMVAEKFLALTDRGMDETTHSRDLIDIAFITARHGRAVLRPGFEMAEVVYGKAVLRAVRGCLSSFARRATYRDASVR